VDLEIWSESRRKERGREKGHVNFFSLENRNPQTGVKEHKKKKPKKKKQQTKKTSNSHTPDTHKKNTMHE